MSANFFKIRNGVNVGVLTADPSGGSVGDMYYNSSTSKLREFVNGSWRDAVTADDTQSLSNKTLDNTTTLTVKDANFTIQDDGDTTKQVKFQASGVTTGTTRTLTVPDASTTIVGTDATQTISNKVIDNTNSETIKDANLTIQNSADTTKQMKFDASGITTGTTRTLSAPDVSSTLLARTSTDQGANRVQNKDLDASNTKIVDNSDTTKKIAFSASGATTGTILTLADNQTTSQSLAVPNVGSGDTLVTNNTTAILASKQLQFSTSTDSTTTGSAATLQAFTSGVVRLTNASLVSVSAIPAGSSGQYLLIENKTGNPVTINNEDAGVTAANRIQTGSGGAITMSANATLAFTYDNTSSRWQLTAGSGSGSASGSGKNYLSAITTSQSTTPNTGNGNFELGSTTGWSSFTTTMSGVTPTGTIGAAGGLTISTVNSGQLAGSYSLNAAHSPITAGQGVISDAFNIDSEDQSKVLTIKFYYKNQSLSSNANFSGTSSNSFAVYIYDVTNAVWIQPAGVYSMTQGSGIGLSTATFQTTSNSTQYRLAILSINTSIFSGSMYFDDFFVGPQVIEQGAAISDWQNFTPTGSWTTNTTYTGRWRRVGDTAEYEMLASLSGAPNAVTLSFNLFSGHVIDTTKITSTNVDQPFGMAKYFRGGGFQGDVRYNSTTSVIVQSLFNPSTTLVQEQDTDATHPGTFANGDFVWAQFRVPIVGWSSNVQMSNDTDTRVVSLRATASTGASMGTPSGSLTAVVYNTIDKDTHGTYNSSTGVYTVPVSGFYDIVAGVQSNATVTAVNQDLALIVDKNSGTTVGKDLYTYPGAGVTGGVVIFVHAKSVFCNAGDTLAIKFSSGATGPAYVTDSTNYLCINRQSGPSVIAATESVNARYTSTAGQSITNGSTVIVNYDTKDYDSHNAVTTGASWKFTSPVSGKYSIKASVFYASANFTSGQPVEAFLYKNGSLFSRLGFTSTDATQSGARRWTAGSDSMNLLAGDFIDIRTAHGETTARSLSAIAGDIHISIERIGN